MSSFEELHQKMFQDLINICKKQRSLKLIQDQCDFFQSSAWSKLRDKICVDDLHKLAIDRLSEYKSFCILDDGVVIHDSDLYSKLPCNVKTRLLQFDADLSVKIGDVLYFGDYIFQKIGSTVVYGPDFGK